MSDPATWTLQSPVTVLKGVGPHLAGGLEQMGLRTLSDLVRHLPHRHEDEHATDRIADLSDLPDGATASAEGVIDACRAVGFGKKGRFEATLSDSTGTIKLTWFNAAWLQRKLPAGLRVRVQGKIKRYGPYLQMVGPKWEIVEEEAPGSEAPGSETPGEDTPGDETPGEEAPGEQTPGGGAPAGTGLFAAASGGAPGEPPRLRPVYPATERVASDRLAALIEQALPVVVDQIEDPVPPSVVQRHAMPTLAEAYRRVHAPADRDEVAAARRRLAFNELLVLQLGVAVKRAHTRRKLTAPRLVSTPELDARIRGLLPFAMTGAQERVVAEIAGDLARPFPMNRLLQGDVGAGKTAVALHAMLLAQAAGKQAALMAPTALLAEQHHAAISRMLEGTGVRVALVTANHREDVEAVAGTQSGLGGVGVDLVVGTHALLSERMAFRDLGLAVIDEQHRFGVRQRAKLRSAGGESPHVLAMTATPIPRTLSLTLLGDLDVSTLDELPPGRTPVATRVVPPAKAPEVYAYADKRVAAGEQVYVVVPSIEPGEHADPDAPALKNVEQFQHELRDRLMPGRRVAVVHGRLKPEERREVMRAFRAHESDVLLATTVIEVGVDVPNAAVMVVEHADRFGLSQLHQLRGRIGRGRGTASGGKPLCVFIAQPRTDEGKERLAALAATSDGFKVAEADLSIRGMGEFFGTRQAGAATLKVAQLPEDTDLLLLARRDAQAVVDADPELAAPEHELLRRVLRQSHRGELGLVEVG